MRAKRRYCLSGKRPAKRRGAITLLVVTLMIIFLVAAVFLVDVAYIQLTRVRLRTATDAAARACGEALSRTQDLDAARNAAITVAAANKVAGETLILTNDDIVFGSAARQPDGSWEFTADGKPITSVRVVGRRTTDSASGAVRLFFANLLGREYFEPQQMATVVGIDRDVCLVVDRSGSMKLSTTDTTGGISSSDPRYCSPPEADSRWMALAAAIQTFVSTMQSTPYEEYLGLVSYASDFTACDITNNVTDLDQTLNVDPTLVNVAINAISARAFNGRTNIAAGIDQGVEALFDVNNSRPYAAKTLVLFTDGLANEGPAPVTAAQAAAAQNVVIHTITFGAGANQADMIAVAEATGGQHYHAPDPAALDVIFRKVALSLSVVLSE